MKQVSEARGLVVGSPFGAVDCSLDIRSVAHALSRYSRNYSFVPTSVFAVKEIGSHEFQVPVEDGPKILSLMKNRVSRSYLHGFALRPPDHVSACWPTFGFGVHPYTASLLIESYSETKIDALVS